MLPIETILPIAILVDGPLDAESIRLQMQKKSLSYTPEALAYIDSKWQERLKKGLSTKDSDVIAFEGIKTDGDDLTIFGSPTKYSFRNGTTQKEFREQFGEDLITRTIGVNVLLQTKDNYIIVAQRNTYRPGKEGGLHIVGGYLEKENLLAGLNDEVAQETGISEDEWEPRTLLGLTQSKETLSVDVNFYGKTDLTKEDVKAKTEDGEIGKVFFQKTLVETKSVLLHFFPTASSAIIGAMYLFGKQNYGTNWANEVLSEIIRIQQIQKKLDPAVLEAQMHSLAIRLRDYQ